MSNMFPIQNFEMSSMWLLFGCWMSALLRRRKTHLLSFLLQRHDNHFIVLLPKVGGRPIARNVTVQ